MAQLLLKTSPKHRDLPVVAAASLGDTAQVSAGRWHCAWPFPAGLPRSEPRGPSLTGHGPHGALTGAQASGLGRSSPFSGRQSRASKYSHWSRGRNFLERAWRPHIRMLATIEALKSGRGTTPGCEPPGPLSGVGHPLALTVTSASLPDPSAWARTHLQHLLGGHCAQHGCHGAQDTGTAQGDGPHQRFIQRLLPRLSLFLSLCPPQGFQGLGQAYHLLCIGLRGALSGHSSRGLSPTPHSDPQAATTLFPRKGSRSSSGRADRVRCQAVQPQERTPGANPRPWGTQPGRRERDPGSPLFIYVFLYILPRLVLLGG